MFLLYQEFLKLERNSKQTTGVTVNMNSSEGSIETSEELDGNVSVDFQNVSACWQTDSTTDHELKQQVRLKWRRKSFIFVMR